MKHGTRQNKAQKTPNTSGPREPRQGLGVSVSKIGRTTNSSIGSMIPVRPGTIGKG